MRRTQGIELSRAHLCKEIMTFHARINRAESKYYDVYMCIAFCAVYGHMKNFLEMVQPFFPSFLSAYCEASSLTAVTPRQEIDFFNAVSEFKNIAWPPGCEVYSGEAPWEIKSLARNRHHALFYTSQLLDNCIKKYPGLGGKNLFQKIFKALLLKAPSQFREIDENLPIFPQVQKGVELFFRRNIVLCTEEMIIPLAGLFAILFKWVVIDRLFLRKMWSRGLTPFERLQLLSQRELLKKKSELEKTCYEEEKSANRIKKLKPWLTTAMIIAVLFVALYNFIDLGELNFTFITGFIGILMINGNLNFNPWGDELSQTKKKLIRLASQLKEMTTVPIHGKEISWVEIETKNEGNSSFSCLYLSAIKHNLLKPKRIMTVLQATLQEYGILFDYDSLLVVIPGDVSLNKVNQRSFKDFFAKLLTASINLYQIGQQLEAINRGFHSFCQYAEGCITDENPVVRWTVVVSDRSIRQELKDVLLENKMTVIEWKKYNQIIEADFSKPLSDSLIGSLVACLRKESAMSITETSDAKFVKRDQPFVRQKKSGEPENSPEPERLQVDKKPERVVWDDKMVYPDNPHIQLVSGFIKHYICLFLPPAIWNQYDDILGRFLAKATTKAPPRNRQGIKDISFNDGSYVGTYFKDKTGLFPDFNGKKGLFPARLKLIGTKGDMTFFLKKKQAPTGEVLYSICGFGDGIH